MTASFCTTAGFTEPLPNPPQAMNPPPVPHSNHGKGKSKHSKGDGDSSGTSISWQADLQCTNKLVNFLVDNTVDCRILFSSEGKKPTDPNIEDPPSGKDKNAIHAVITDVIFSGNKVYVGQYAANQLCPLMRVLQKIYMKEFPWYDNLYKIWDSNPSFAAKTTSSKPGTDHAGDLFALMHPAGGSAHPPLQCNMSSTNAATDSGIDVLQINYPPPSHLPPSHFAPYQFDFAPPPHQSGQQGGMSGSHPQWNYNVSLQSAHPGSIPAPQFNFTTLPQNTQLGNVSGSPLHWNYGLPSQGTYAGGVTGSLPTPQYNFTPPSTECFTKQHFWLPTMLKL
ncbi:hypothetical protein F4604DRAFT_1686078 [Suillus subluteus]|nr:hypothetical protein F4604DRAFT_1686078 [Suillus subluteus]